jgi:hypothetical protein
MVHIIKHPFPAGKLQMRGLFRVTFQVIGLAAVVNLQRIHHYLQAKMKAEEQQECALEVKDIYISFAKDVMATSYFRWSVTTTKIIDQLVKCKLLQKSQIIFQS